LDGQADLSTKRQANEAAGWYPRADCPEITGFTIDTCVITTSETMDALLQEHALRQVLEGFIFPIGKGATHEIPGR
jgi:hypothetical protein